MGRGEGAAGPFPHSLLEEGSGGGRASPTVVLQGREGLGSGGKCR